MVTVQLAFFSRAATGVPTMSERPITTACLPANCTPVCSNKRMHPLGVQGRNSGFPSFFDSSPTLYLSNPSTSFSVATLLVILTSLMCLGSGNCTKTPLTLESSFKSRILFNRVISWVSSGNLTMLHSTPDSVDAFSFIRTYAEESGLSPTWIIVKEGLKLGCLAWICSIACLASKRICEASLVPERIWAALHAADVLNRCNRTLLKDGALNMARNQ
ncbi:hypothetical protein OGAPHI_006616 [Ogataea philodendri]|uniref:Uncharacterized protein n=1 Tax=Ogataea philodendri TaxID=1378263 RepID=A0A9P8NXF8_9ASCO|nr:uncharacterized protein OGAPHI_006616 [Ogataea philodendri]KAH3661209.1 hypothetical protein OGAPHI_006616 [Ogataea philodendri]